MGVGQREELYFILEINVSEVAEAEGDLDSYYLNQQCQVQNKDNNSTYLTILS